MDNYDNTFDNTDSVHFTSQALFDRTSRYQNSYTLPFRPREARHRISSAGSAFKESTNHIADLAQELKIQHDERTFSMPRRERGRYWTWAMFPGARLGLPAQKDIDNARSIFNASLTSQVEAIDATEYFSRNGPTLTVEDMRVHMELFLEIYMKMLHEGDKKVSAKISTQFLRDHASRVFTALSRASNFVPMDVVIGTYEWIDEYLRVKFDLRAYRDEALDWALPMLDIAASIRSRSTNTSQDEQWYESLCGDEDDGVTV